jgi:hypothetical protein
MALVGGASASLAMWAARPLQPLMGPPPLQVTAHGTVQPYAVPPVATRHADFAGYAPTADARTMADWVVSRADNGGAPFMVLDKVDARVYLFTPDGRMLGNSPVLLGKARGDDSVPGIGTMPLNKITDDMKTTPAGRFQTAPGKNLNGEEVVWVDYDDAISMHRVRKVAESEHRFERLATPTPLDNRISYGCINVPVAFFDTTIVPTLGKQRGVAYIIPEVKTIAQVFQEGAPVVASVAPATGGRVTTDR